MTCELDELRGQIPFYLNGTLLPDERKIFEDRLNKYPELKRELQEFLEIKSLYKDIEKEIPLLSDAVYHKIHQSIQSGKTASSASERRGMTGSIQEFFKSLFFSPRIAWGVVLAQLVIVVILVHAPIRESFRTLTSEYIQKKEGVGINIIFHKESKEKEIRDILNRFGASIISGPSPEGLYVIKLKDRGDVEKALADMKRTRIVLFAERAY